MPQAIPESIRVATSRRQFLGASLAVAAVMAPSATKAIPPTDDDSELVALAERIKVLDAEYRTALDRSVECDAHYQAMKPEIPEALFARFGDELDTLTWKTTEKDGRVREVYALGEIDSKLRGRTDFYRWGFNGTWDELAELGVTEWHDNRIRPVTSRDDLFFSVGHEQRAKRAAEIVTAFDGYRTGDEAALQKSGYETAEADVDRILNRMSDVVERMLEIKPKTLRGAKALAVAVLINCWSGKIVEDQTEEGQLINHLIESLVSDDALAVRIPSA